MIRFRIVGSGYLELPSDFEFSFSYNNGVFAFENMQLSRSGEFTIPRTPINDVMLDFSHDASRDGNYIRKKKLCELFYSGGKIDGYLFISKYADKGYSAIFVYGELTALKSINDRGNISEYVQFPDYITTNSTNILSSYNASGVLPYFFKFYNYKNGIADGSKLVSYANLSPTVKLSYLLSQAAIYAGINIDVTALGPGNDAIGVILQTNNSTPTPETINVSGAPNNTLNFTGGSNFFELTTKKFKYQTQGYMWWVNHSQVVNVLQCKTDVTVLFNVGYGMKGCVTGDGTTFISNMGHGEAFFQDITEGQEVQFKKGDYFTFVSEDDYSFRRPINKYQSSLTVQFQAYISDVGNVDVNEDYYLQYNLPEVTFIDLLKTYANIFKCGILYNSVSNTISFFNFNFDKSNAKKLDDIMIGIKSVDRTFLNYAKRNIINFKSEDYVDVDKRSTIQYLIDNDNLSETKTLYTVPFNDGIMDETSNVFLKEFELVAPYKKTAKQNTIAIASKTTGNNYLMHIRKLYDNFSITDYLTNIITNSTTIVMTVKMSAGDFLKIGNTDSFSYRGKHYCCITGTHTGNTAELTLIRI